jgi:hypothetical protein
MQDLGSHLSTPQSLHCSLSSLVHMTKNSRTNATSPSMTPWTLVLEAPLIGTCAGPVVVGLFPTSRLGVDACGIVEVREVVGEVAMRFGVDCKIEVGTISTIEVGTGTAIGVGVGIGRVDIAGIKTDRVEVIMPIEVITPPAPVHLFPFGQQPYSPFVPRSQKLPKGQPPVLSGQHVSDILMHPVPQSFLPCCEQGIGVKVWRRTSCSESSAVTKATAAKSR